MVAASLKKSTITVSVNGDVTQESNETFSVVLTGASGATIADGTGVGTIVNDDSRPTVSISDVSQDEGDSGKTPFAFVVSLSNPSDQPVTVNYSTVDGSAT